MAVRAKKFKNTFENGGYWEYYKALEAQFEDYLKYVPYIDINKKTCSYRLSNMLKDVGGYIDSSFKVMAKYKKFSKNKDCIEIIRKVKETRTRRKSGLGPIGVKIEECLSAFETEYKLSSRKVIFKRLPERELLVPFSHPTSHAPEWWDIYNGLKHDFSEFYEKANLKIIRDAMAGAFLLNAIHVPGADRLCKHGLIRDSVGKQVTNCPTFRACLDGKSPTYSFLETPIFFYDYDQ